MSIFGSYFLWMILFIYSTIKINDNKPKYVKGYMFFILPFFHIAVIIMLIISIVITLIGGSIPAKIASKKNPVEALRTE